MPKKLDVLMRVPSRLITLAEGQDDSAPEKIELIRCGTFYTPDYGKFSITPDILKSFKKNFDAKVRGVDLAVDYKHASEDIAAGWFKGLTLADDGNSLWADVKWTPNGNKVLADKEFRYISADFNMKYKDNETLTDHGPTLMGAGLTNRPVVKNMEPVIELSERKEDEMDPKDKEIADLKAQCADQAKKLSDMSAEMDKLKKPAAPAADADDVELGKKDAEIKTLSEKIVLMEKGTKFDKMLSEGKVVEAQRESFLGNDMIKFSELAQPVKTTTEGSGGQPNVVPAKDSNEAQAQILTLAEAKVKAKDAKDMSTAIVMVLSENKELAAKYNG